MAKHPAHCGREAEPVELKDLNEETKKAMDEMKEASRRIKSAGLGRTESEAEDASVASARWDLC